MLHGWQYLTEADRETILRGIGAGEAYGGPYHFELNWVDKCNARCFFCNSAGLQNGQSIPWERALALLEEAHGMGLRSIRLAGGGEPTLHPQLPDLLEWMAGRGVALDSINTNGAQFADGAGERLIEALARVPANDIQVSLNYADEATYAQGMGLPAKFFGRVCEGLRRLAELRRRPGSRLGAVIVQFFIYKPTRDHIAKMHRLGLELGADRIVFRELFDIDAALQYDEADGPRIAAQLREALRADWNEGRVESLVWSRGVGAAMLAARRELAAELGPSPHEAPLKKKYDHKYCYIAWHSMTIMGNEVVYPCCFYMTNAKAPSLGALSGQTIREIWQGEGYRRLRKEFHDYFMLQARVPLFAKRNRLLQPNCATHTECSLIHSMCDEDFYVQADARLEAERRRAARMLWRAPNLVGRMAIDAMKGKG